MFGFKVGRRWVSTCGDFARQLTVPGGAAVPTAAVTVVTVHPPYRRRGLLTQMMVHQLEQVAKRGEPLAALWASESLIYGRFGYGPASSRARAQRAPTGASRFLPGVRTSGSVDEVTREEFLAVARGLHESMRPERPGTMARDDDVWEFAIFDKAFARAAPRRCATSCTTTRPATPTGSRRTASRTKFDEEPAGEVRVKEVWAEEATAYASHLALPARPRPGAQLQAVELAARRAAAPPGRGRARGRDVRHRQPLPARRRRRGGAARPEVRRRRRPRHRGRRPDPARQLGPLPDRHRRRPGRLRRPR